MNENNNDGILLDEENSEQQAGMQKEKRSLLEFLKYRFSPPKLMATIAIVVVVAIVITGGVIFFNYRSPSSIAERYAKASILGKTETMYKLSAYDTHEYMLDENETEEKFFNEQSNELMEDIESWADYEKVMSEQAQEYLADQFGKFKLSTEVKRVKDISVRHLLSELEKSINILESRAGFDKNSITDCKRVDIKITVDGEDDTERLMYSIYMVEIDGQWKVLQYVTEFLK